MAQTFDVNLDDYKYGFSVPENYAFKSRKGLDEDIVREISWMKGEPEWMLEFRLRGYRHFLERPMPQWGGHGQLDKIDFDDIYYYIKPTDAEKAFESWDDVPEDIKNTFDRLGIPEAEQKFLAGVGAQYECLSGDARVYTAHGLVPIREIEPGDTVFAFDESQNQLVPALVKARAYKGEREVFEVRVGTRTIHATNNHPFLTLTYYREPGKQRGRYHRQWKYLRELKPGDLVAVAKNLPDVGQPYTMLKPEIKTEVVGRNQTGVEYTLDISNHYNKIALPEKTSVDLMWWLGFYIGDGFLHYQKDADKARVEFAVPVKDTAMRTELGRVTQNLFDLPARNGDVSRITVYSTILARYIETNGFGGTAHTKRVPQWVYTLPEVQRLSFLGGYVDADGYVRDYAKNHDMSLTSVNRELLQDVQALAALCNIPTSSIHRFESKHPFDKERTMVGYRIQFSGDFERIACRSPKRIERMSKRLYHHNYSSAKGTTFRSHTNEFVGFAKIDSITPAGVEPVYDIEVDGPHNFVAEGLIVHNSEVIYHSLIEDLENKGVIFLDMDAALREHPDIVKEYFTTIIPPEDNKFAALNTAVWSGGSFIYVPPGVHVDLPLQAYFRINAQNMGQFERTLIIADKGSYVHYVEGCFLAGARVRTKDGEKPIEEIREGDEVLTHQGRYRKVYHTMQRPYQGMVYHIRYFGDSGQELHVTTEHPLLVVRREKVGYRNQEFKTEWLRADEVKPGDYLAIPIPQAEAIVEKGTHTVAVPIGRGRHAPVMTDVALPMEPDFFRLLGYYYTEGHVDQEHYLTFSFNVNETTYLNDTRTLINRYFGKAPVENKPRQNGQTLVLCSTEVARTFANEFGSTIYDKRVPRLVKDAPPEHLIEWVRGMWRGDGSYDKQTNKFRYSTVSKDLAYAFRDALLRLGVASSVNYHERPEPRRPMYTVVISTPWNSKFGEFVGHSAPNGRQSGSPFVLDENYMYVPIRSIEIEEMDTTVYNFSVEEDESYICEGVVSHNCTAPTYSSDSLHSAVVEIIVKEDARVRYSTIQNWSRNVYNLVTKRAQAYRNATMEWVDGNLGCLAEGSTVTIPTGVKRIEDLEVGEQVLSFDESTGEFCFRRVTAKQFSGHQHVREVSYGERRLWVTDNHPFYSYRYTENRAKKLGRYQLGYVRADELTEAIIPRTSIDYGEAYPLTRPTTETAFASYNQYNDSFVATRVREPHLSTDFRKKVEAVHPAKLAYHRNVGRSNIELPDSVEIVKVSAGEPSEEKLPTWDIEVEGTGNFVSEGFIVHNSKLTMKYPAVWLMEPGAHGEVLSIAFAGNGQLQDAGGKIVHVAPNTSSVITSKSISKNGGRSTYRGLVKVAPGATNSKSNVVCDALILDDESASDTFPYIEIEEQDVTIGHEASVSKVSEEQLFYLMSRGIPEDRAANMIVSGFIEPIVKELPMEYALELNRLIEMEMEGSVG